MLRLDYSRSNIVEDFPYRSKQRCSIVPSRTVEPIWRAEYGYWERSFLVSVPEALVTHTSTKIISHFLEPDNFCLDYLYTFQPP